MTQRLSLVLALVSIAAATAACSGSDAVVGDPGGASSSGASGRTTDGDGALPSGANVSSHAEQVNGRCPSSPQKLTGSRTAGESCSTFADCKPTCCDCTSGTSYLAGACVDGACASAEVACGRARKTFCGETSSSSSGGSSSSSSGGSSSGGSSSGSTSSSGGSGGKVCVDGTAGSCYGRGMTWTGAQCCVPAPTTCTDGTAGSCYGSDMMWTGKQCCLTGARTCVSGTAGSCYGSVMDWTGAKCCLEKAVTCVSGTAGSCYGTGKHWTGALCCLE